MAHSVTINHASVELFRFGVAHLALIVRCKLAQRVADVEYVRWVPGRTGIVDLRMRAP